MKKIARRWRVVLGIGVGLLGLSGTAEAQGTSPAIGRSTSRTVGGGAGLSTTSPYANPFGNPALNPFLNPALTQQQMNRSDMMLYFLAAQQSRKAAAADAMPSPPAGRFAPSRPVPNGPIPGRFDDNPTVNDSRNRLATRFPAYGRITVDSATGTPLIPGTVPSANAGVNRYFNRGAGGNGFRSR